MYIKIWYYVYRYEINIYNVDIINEVFNEWMSVLYLIL